MRTWLLVNLPTAISGPWPRRRLASVLAVLVATASLAADGDAAMERLLRAPAVRHPLVFAWGATSAQVERELAADSATRIRERDGDREIVFEREGIEYRYSFFRRVGPVLAADPASIAGADPSAILFAVTLVLPGVALHSETGRELMSVLEAGYGRATNRTNTHLDLENLSTGVRVYLEKYRRAPYIRRLTFVSKGLAQERNRQYQGAIRVGRALASGRAPRLWDFSEAAAGAPRSSWAGGRAEETAEGNGR